jgi:DNA-binding MarR family transcriptional regulator
MSPICQKTGRRDINLTGTGLCAGFNLRRTSRVVTALYDAALAKAGLSSTQVAILIVVAKSEPVPMGILARMILTDHSTLTRNLALLSKEGLVTVSRRSAMRRRLISLTPEGTAALVRSLRPWRRIQARFVESFGERRWKETREVLDELAAIAVRLCSH